MILLNLDALFVVAKGSLFECWWGGEGSVVISQLRIWFCVLIKWVILVHRGITKCNYIFVCILVLKDKSVCINCCICYIIQVLTALLVIIFSAPFPCTYWWKTKMSLLKFAHIFWNSPISFVSIRYQMSYLSYHNRVFLKVLLSF